jgi:sRNA-binding carbon storage regulator CsrA
MMPGLVLSRREGEVVVFEGLGTLAVNRIAGGAVSLGFDFSPDVIIRRKELGVMDKKQQESTPESACPQWAIVEVMGHGMFAGQCSEVVVAGQAFLRVDVPAVSFREPFTKLLGTASIFGITPCTEEAARLAANRIHARPAVSRP